MARRRNLESTGLYLCDKQKYPLWAIVEIDGDANVLRYRRVQDDADGQRGTMGEATQTELNALCQAGCRLIVDPLGLNKTWEDEEGERPDERYEW